MHFWIFMGKNLGVHTGYLIFIIPFTLYRKLNRKPTLFVGFLFSWGGQGLTSAFSTDMDILYEWMERWYLGMKENE